MAHPIPSPSPQRAPSVALTELLDTLREIPEAADLAKRGQWSIAFGRLEGALHGSRFAVEPFELLGVLAGRLGGSIRPDGGPFDVGTGLKQMHALHTTWMDVPLKISVAVPAASEVERLRARIAELEAAQVGR